VFGWHVDELRCSGCVRRHAVVRHRPAGDIVIPNLGRSNIFEYARGGKAPKAILRDPGEQPYDCSVDPVTGNLAVANADGTISIYIGAKGAPKIYGNPRFAYMFFLGYDNHGSLFVDGQNDSGQFPELPKGARRLVNVSLDAQIEFHGVFWDGTYVVVGEGRPIRRLTGMHEPIGVALSPANRE
jgi:hypothetical protein